MNINTGRLDNVTELRFMDQALKKYIQTSMQFNSLYKKYWK